MATLNTAQPLVHRALAVTLGALMEIPERRRSSDPLLTLAGEVVQWLGSGGFVRCTPATDDLERCGLGWVRQALHVARPERCLEVHVFKVPRRCATVRKALRQTMASRVLNYVT